MSHHHQKNALRVEFTEPAVQERQDFDAAIAQIAEQVGIAPDECFEVTRFKTKKPKQGRKVIGTAEIVVLKGCPNRILSLFKECHAFTAADLAPVH